MEHRYFTTHEAAQLIGVSLPTIINWIKSGRLTAHRTLGGHRRIERDVLAAFIRRHGLPMPSALLEESSAPRILALTGSKADPTPVLELLRRAGFQALSAQGLLSIGFALGQSASDALLLDLPSLGARAFSILEELRERQGYRPPPVFALGNPHDERLCRKMSELGFQEIFDPAIEPVIFRQRVAWFLRGI
ncbi:MAG: helix-turn-helix domain-containing protein [Myxococcales bacterium]|jgi:excisionase family DNA binding protein|nr:helix-turn-helix domain-containing protein [Myxococcales bacterium]